MVACAVCGSVGHEGEECERCAAWTMMAYALGRPPSMHTSRPAPRTGAPWYAWIPPILGLAAAGWFYWQENLMGAAAAAGVSVVAGVALLFVRRSPRGPR